MKPLALFVLAFILVPISAVAEQTCDQQQALEMLTRMGTFKHQYMRDNSGKPGKIEKIKELATRSAHGGTLIGQQKFDAACAHYQQLAQDFGFDLSKSEAMSVEAIGRYDSKAEEGCDIRSIVMRSNQIHRNLAKMRNQIGTEKYQQLKARASDLGLLMRTDLAGACAASRDLEMDLSGYQGG